MNAQAEFVLASKRQKTWRLRKMKYKVNRKVKPTLIHKSGKLRFQAH